MLATPSVAIAAAVDDPSVAVQRATRQLHALNTAGIKTLGQLAEAKSSVVASVVGPSKGRALQAAARRHIGSRGLVDGKTPLHQYGIVDPTYIVNPIWKTDRSTQARLDKGEQERKTLAKLGLESYADMAKANPAVVARVVGKSRAEAMIARAKIIVEHTGGGQVRRAKTGAILPPQLAGNGMSAGFVADPGAAPLPSPHPIAPTGKASANPTPHP